jgi:glycosyltransferase involved in cell wall biosynthesis
MLLTGVLLSKGNGKPVIYDSHELWVDGSDSMPRLYRRLMTYHEKYLIPHVSRVVTVNDHIADALFERYNIERPLVVFNCPLYSPPLEKNKQFNNSVIYQGRYYITRGLEQAIESAKYIDCNMYFRGFDYYSDTYTTTLKNLVSTDNVFFIPPVPMPELVSSLDGFDVGMVPYRPTVLNNIYSSPNKLFEYMMAGMVVIGSDLPVIGGIIKSSGCGVVFNPDDPESIANAINTVMHDRDKLKEMKKLSCKAAKERWNWEVQSKPLIEEYTRLTK